MDINAIRARLKAEAEQRAKAQTGGTGSTRRNNGDNAVFPFWDIAMDTDAVVRFLPDGNPDNTYFWVRREVIKLPFAGVVGGEYPTNRQAIVTVPCVDMFEGMRCPIIAATKHLWKEDEALARTYWKKKSYIYQGFVVDSSLAEEAPENPIRRFVINPSIHEIVEKSLMSPDMEDSPTDYINGCDFRINKTRRGEYANYGSSNWARKTRSLSEQERIAIDQYGLKDLSEFQGQKPDAEGMEIIKAMFDDSFAGKPFDYASYGQYYRAYTNKSGVDSEAISAVTRPAQAPAAATPAQAAAPVTTPTYVSDAPAETPAPAPQEAAAPAPSAMADTNDIMARIRQRAAAGNQG